MYRNTQFRLFVATAPKRGESIQDIILGRYHIVQYFDAGGMSEVYLAVDSVEDKYVIVKTCNHNNKSVMCALANEYRILSLLSHNGVPKVYEYGTVSNMDYIVMEHIDGNNLSNILKDNKYVWTDYVDIIVGLCHILVYMHSCSVPVFHCDIKPENIIVSRTGRIVLIDYGTAVSGNEESFKTQYGTLSYAAPEQFDNNAVIDERTDIFSVGILLKQIIGHISNRRIKRRLDSIIMRCTYEDAQLRYEDVSDVISELLFLSGKSGIVKSVFVP